MNCIFLTCYGLQLYIEGYLQALLDTIYKQEYLRVRVVDNQVTDFLLNIS